MVPSHLSYDVLLVQQSSPWLDLHATINIKNNSVLGRLPSHHILKLSPQSSQCTSPFIGPTVGYDNDANNSQLSSVTPAT